ncbi:MAG: amidohydrolase family protein, partial [Caldisericia bacterium]|nr:amidohydrolase family protein [Caldisericia bacterium]
MSKKTRVDLIVRGISEFLTVSGIVPKIGAELQNIGLIKNGAFAVAGGVFIGVGTSDEIFEKFESDNIFSAKGMAVLPGFVDPHTHAVYGGERSKEFEQRLEGVSYEKIMADGGGILSSVKMTRDATDSELESSAKKRLKNMISHGTTSVEIKSGYGLDTETELRMLKVAGKVADELGITYKRTFLGAHSVPAGYDRKEYINTVKGEMLTACKPHADFIDVFCDKGVFTNEETEEIVKSSGLPVRL